MTTNEEHDECEVEEVVKDEVTSYPGCRCDIFGVGREEAPDVSDLENKENEPVYRSDDGVQGEWGDSSIVDAPDCMTPVLLIIVWDMVGVVDAGDNDQDVGEDGQGLINPDTLGAMGLASREWVHAATTRHCKVGVSDLWNNYFKSGRRVKEIEEHWKEFGF